MIKKATPEPGFKYDDSRRPLLAAARSGAIALAMITALSLLVWGGKSGMPGIRDVLPGAGISGSFVLLTVLGTPLTTRISPSVTLAAVLGGWLLKTVVLIGVLVVVRSLELYDNMTFFVTVALTLTVVLGAEV